MNKSSRANAVLFDLDGTLADTSPDMADALNELLVLNEKNTLAYEEIRKHTSRGGLALVKLGFGENLEKDQETILRQQFLELYANRLCNKTKLFPGVSEILDSLDESNIPWGIVTNKPGYLAEPLIQELGIAFRTVCMVSGDSLAKRKPHPEPLFHAANIIGADSEKCVYMGDDPRDIQAGKAAKMKTAVAAYGYILDEEDPYTWDADVVFENALQLKNWLFNAD